MSAESEPGGAAVARWITSRAATLAAALAALAGIGGAIGWAAANIWTWHDARIEILLLTEADHSIINAISRHVDTRAEAICAEQIEALRGDVEASLDTPPTMADISRRQREDSRRLIRLEALHEVGRARSIAEREREEAELRDARGD